MQGCSYRQLAAEPTAVGRTTTGFRQLPGARAAGSGAELAGGLTLDGSGEPTDMARLGPMAEWLRRGLQILARRFDSGSGLHPYFET